MKVQDVMTSDVKSCDWEADLARVASLMWENDCGIIPIVGEGDRVAGVITDRDICIAVSTKLKLASEIHVHEVVTPGVETCRPEEDLREALKKMAAEQVRRLPVVNPDGKLVGVLSLNDVALHAAARKGRKGAVTLEDVARTLQSICKATTATRTPPPAEAKA